MEETHKKQSWDKIYAVHQQNVKEYGAKLSPISIVVTKDIAECVEQWQSLVAYLVKKEKIKPRRGGKKGDLGYLRHPHEESRQRARVDGGLQPAGRKDSPTSGGRKT